MAGIFYADPEFASAPGHLNSEGTRRPEAISNMQTTSTNPSFQDQHLIGHYSNNGPSIHDSAGEGYLEQEQGRSSPSSTMSEKLPRKKRRSFGSLIFVDSWIWEFVSWLTSAACVAAIVAILNTYDGQPIPWWSSGITLNALISVFTSIAKIASMFTIAQSIGQLKWIWFSAETRDIEDFEVLENASKGVGGSIQLLAKPKRRYWASLGAIAMVASTMLEPFTQQIVSFPQKLSPFSGTTTAASIAYSQNFTAGVPSSFGRIGGLGRVETTGHLDASMILSIHSGAFHPANVSIESLAPECTTGNCTFPDFLSIAICSKGDDITHLLRQNCDASANNCDRTLPNGMSLGTLGSSLNISTNSFPTLAFPNIAHPIANIFIMYYEAGSSSTVKAAEFVFEYCVKRYHTIVSDGHSQTTVLGTYTNYTTGYWDPILLLNSSTLVFSVPDTPTTFSVTKLAQSGMTEFMKDFFTGGIRIANGPIFPVSGASIVSFDIAGPISRAIEYSPSNQAGIQRLMDNIAMSITNNIRSRNNAAEAPQQGIAYVLVTFVHVDWPWISMLALLVLLVLVLLISTVVQSWCAKTKLWKSSSLAVLRAGTAADEGLRTEWGASGMKRPDLLQLEGSGVRIKLVNMSEPGQTGWRLVKG